MTDLEPIQDPVPGSAEDKLELALMHLAEARVNLNGICELNSNLVIDATSAIYRIQLIEKMLRPEKKRCRHGFSVLNGDCVPQFCGGLDG